MTKATAPPLAALLCYIQFAVLLLFGHLRDYAGRIFGRSRYKPTQSKPGYARQLVAFNHFFTKRVYHRIQDAYHRPVTSAPGKKTAAIHAL